MKEQDLDVIIINAHDDLVAIHNKLVEILDEAGSQILEGYKTVKAIREIIARLN